MSDVFIFLFDHLGAAALVLILGYAADQVSTPALKTYVVHLIKSRTRKYTQPGSNFFASFLNGFIEPLFGKRTLTFSFFIRSCLVSFIFLIAIFCLQLIIYGKDAFNQLRIVQYSAPVNALLLLVLILCNFAIDYISNAKSISLLRMAANSGRPSNVILMFFADTTLTVSIFSALFPLALTLLIRIEEPFRPSAQVTIAPVQEPLRALIEQQQPIPVAKYAQFKTNVFYLSETGVKGTPFSSSAPTITIYAPANHEDYEVIKDYLSVLKEKLPNFTAVSDEGGSGTVAVQLSAPNIPQGVFQLALDPETDVNRVEVMWNVLRLIPFVVPLSTVYERVRAVIRPKFLTVACTSGKIHTSSKINQVDDSCEPTLLFITNGPELDLPFRIASSTNDGFPVSPFFYTSFALANLYYASIFLFVAGSFFLRLISFAFSTPYLESTSKPFTLLATVLFPIIVALSLVLKLVF